MEVYVDLLLLVNLGLNWWALWLTGYLAGAVRSGRRLCAAASLGAFYALGLVTPWVAWFQHPLSKLAVASLMALLAYRPEKLLGLVQVVATFLVVNFATAGFVYGIYNLLVAAGQRSLVLAYGQLPTLILLLAVASLALLSTRFLNLLENRLVPIANRASVQVFLDGREITLNGLVDSGNQLTAPFSGQPVAVVSLDEVAPLLPPEVVELARSPDPYSAVQGVSATEWAARLRFIPYHAVGRPAGVLVGVRSDRLIVHCRDISRETRGAVLALSPEVLTGGGEYQVLVPVRLLPGKHSTQSGRYA
ncbi:MAG: sigma-E processing peptidase SpoIIGA [Bacillota bacterium]|jgi:stage II sporulation protein GA (sporulation sigma-E factor processing peptidase)